MSDPGRDHQFADVAASGRWAATRFRRESAAGLRRELTDPAIKERSPCARRAVLNGAGEQPFGRLTSGTRSSLRRSTPPSTRPKSSPELPPETRHADGEERGTQQRHLGGRQRHLRRTSALQQNAVGDSTKWRSGERAIAARSHAGMPSTKCHAPESMMIGITSSSTKPF